jgi:hypothetical protein
MIGWVWKGCCYGTDEPYPFGFCYACWVNHGSPKAMNTSGQVKVYE